MIYFLNIVISSQFWVLQAEVLVYLLKNWYRNQIRSAGTPTADEKIVHGGLLHPW